MADSCFEGIASKKRPEDKTLPSDCWLLKHLIARKDIRKQTSSGIPPYQFNNKSNNHSLATDFLINNVQSSIERSRVPTQLPHHELNFNRNDVLAKIIVNDQLKKFNLNTELGVPNYASPFPTFPPILNPYLEALRMPAVHKSVEYASLKTSKGTISKSSQLYEKPSSLHHQKEQDSAISDNNSNVASLCQIGSNESPMGKRQKVGRPATFICQLYKMLKDLEKTPGGTDIASFLPNGHTFAIHKPKEFVESIVPQYFRMSSFPSFQRQLNMYGFYRLSGGADKGSYYHASFIRGQPQLLREIKRVQRK